MRATKIKMMPGCGYSNNLNEIDEIYLTECSKEGLLQKSSRA